MSIVLTSYPVTVESGVINNIFPGYTDVELEFKREDIPLNSLGSGVDSQAEIVVTGDITGNVNVGEYVYIYAIGTTYTYDGAFEVLAISYGAPNTTILLKTPFVEGATTGYANYYQNYFLESKLVNPDNTAILEYNGLLSDNGTPSGIIKVNVSQLVDKLSNEILLTSGEVTAGRNKCKVMYREVWRENQTNPFVLVGATPTVDNDTVPIVIIYAADEIQAETFVNKFTIPKMWEGYTFILPVLHSLQNNAGLKVSVKYDQLDINKDNINTDNPLVVFGSNNHGMLQVNMNDNLNAIDNNTRYLKFNASGINLADYKAGDYKAGDYSTI